MKILKITPWYPNEINPLSGSFVEDQAIALSKQGEDVAVLFVDLNYRNILKKLKTHHFKTIFKIEKGIKVFRYYGFFPPKISLRLHTQWSIYFDILFKKYIEKFGLPSIIHAHTFHTAYAASFLSEKYNIPFVITEHSTILITRELHGWRRQIFQKSFQNASKVISVSNGLRDVLKSIISNEILVIPNLIDTDLFSIKNQKPIKKTFQIIAAGDLIPRKGFHILIEAFSQLDASLKKNMCLKIFGQGSENNRLTALIKKLREDKRIFLEGEVSRDILSKKMKDSDLYVLSSLTETFGIVVIEAMATGLPVISTKCVGPEKIIPEFAGAFIPINDIAALKNGIEQLYLNFDSYQPKQIRQYVLDNFSEIVVANKLKTIYQSSLKEGK